MLSAEQRSEIGLHTLDLPEGGGARNASYALAKYSFTSGSRARSPACKTKKPCETSMDPLTPHKLERVARVALCTTSAGKRPHLVFSIDTSRQVGPEGIQIHDAVEAVCIRCKVQRAPFVRQEYVCVGAACEERKHRLSVPFVASKDQRRPARGGGTRHGVSLRD